MDDATPPNIELNPVACRWLELFGRSARVLAAACDMPAPTAVAGLIFLSLPLCSPASVASPSPSVSASARTLASNPTATGSARLHAPSARYVTVECAVPSPCYLRNILLGTASAACHRCRCLLAATYRTCTAAAAPSNSPILGALEPTGFASSPACNATASRWAHRSETRRSTSPAAAQCNESDTASEVRDQSTGSISSARACSTSHKDSTGKAVPSSASGVTDACTFSSEVADSLIERRLAHCFATAHGDASYALDALVTPCSPSARASATCLASAMPADGPVQSVFSLVLLEAR